VKTREIESKKKTTRGEADLNCLAFRRDDGKDHLVLLLVEAHVLGVVEDAEQVVLNGVGVAGLTQDLQQGGVRHEEEARESQTLLFQVPAYIVQENSLNVKHSLENVRYYDTNIILFGVFSQNV
jgi:hypothetical protein